MVKKRKKPVLSAILLLLILAGCIFAPIIANHDPAKFYLDALNTPPGREFYFGTDSLGRDIFSILFYGGRTSLSIGCLGALLIAFIGLIYGCISGILPDSADHVLMRIAQIGGSIPSILSVLLLSSLISRQNILTLSLVIGITGWFSTARIVRNEVRQLRNREYILYARNNGGSFFYVMHRHVIPAIWPTLIPVLVSNVSTCITMESTLSFLGLGLPVDTLSWGSMLSLANRALLINTWWVIVIPGVFLVVTLLCLTNVARYFRKETDHRHSNL